MHPSRLTGLPVLVFGVACLCLNLSANDLFAQEKGRFASWNDVPTIIDSITENDFQQQLDKLYELTWIKLGNPRDGSDEEQQRHALQIKQDWQQWWESTGKPVTLQKAQDARIDQPAFQLAWEFLGIKQEPPKSISPVWIPETWTLYVTFTNGD